MKCSKYKTCVDSTGFIFCAFHTVVYTFNCVKDLNKCGHTNRDLGWGTASFF